jgi:hypothetical protein
MRTRQVFWVRLVSLAALIWLIIACGRDVAREPAAANSPSQSAADAVPTVPPTTVGMEETATTPALGPAETPTVAPRPPQSPQVVAGSLSLTVLAPVDGSTVSAPGLQVRGTTSPRAVVSVNGELAHVDQNGGFAVTVALDEGPNLIQVIASDRSGAIIEKELVVMFKG